MIEEAILKLSKREDLSAETIRESFRDIVDGKASDVQTAAFLMGLTVKGEQEEEIFETAKLFRELSLRINAPTGAIDIVGTGGDKSGTFNISTATSFVVAGAGVPVAKHGNRAASSQCGSIDVLEELGVKVDMSPQQAERVLHECGITVLFAPLYHPAMKRVAQVRRELKIRTIFNILGPMLNPAQVKSLLIGVFAEQYMEVIARVLVRLGVQNLMIVSSSDHLDELSLSSTNKIVYVKNDSIVKEEFDGVSVGLPRIDLSQIKGGDKRRNRDIILSVLRGEKGAPRDTVLLNAAAALQVAKVAKSWQEGIEIAKESIDSGKALSKLNQLIELSNRG